MKKYQVIRSSGNRGYVLETYEIKKDAESLVDCLKKLKPDENYKIGTVY